MEFEPKSVNILLVDDEPKNLTALEAVLAADDRRLIKARSGEDALRWLLREQFAVVLLDVHMPGMDGFETAALMREHHRSEATPIIFLTAANKDYSHVSRGYSLGAVDYLFKPFDPAILRSKVAVFVDLFSKTEQVRHQAEQAQLLIREQAARAAAEAAHQRFAFLAEASSELARLLDDDSALQRVADLTITAFADACTIDLATETGAVRRAAVGYRDALQQKLLETLPPCLSSRVIDTGYSALLPVLTRDDVRALAGEGPDPEQPGFRSALLVPIPGRDRIHGAISLFSSQPDRSYGKQDLDFTEDLARRVGLALDNAELYHNAQEALQSRDAFFSSAYHDLKTPLAVIKGHAQLLRRRAGRMGEEGTKIVDGLATIESATTRLVRMIEEMLDVARLQSGQPLTLNRQPTDLVELVQSITTQFAQTAGRRKIRMTPPESQLVGSWDPVRLERVLGNLLSNAKEYSPEGSEITVTVSREEDETGAWAVLHVQDQGIGIPADELERVFERYFRGRNVTGRTDGTGIGLAGVKQIVDEHQGAIRITSEEGVGTGVTVRLPLEASAVPAPS